MGLACRFSHYKNGGKLLLLVDYRIYLQVTLYDQGVSKCRLRLHFLQHCHFVVVILLLLNQQSFPQGRCVIKTTARTNLRDTCEIVSFD